MQVNKDRFPAVLPHFLSLLESCDFYAFDEEMTGINVPEMPESITFSPEESYQSKRLAASRYNMIQVGICLFHKEAADTQQQQQQCYTARPFNFILFPHWTDELAQLELPQPTPAPPGCATRSGLSGDVVLSPSALSFLRRHGMDFQQWVYEGISLCDSAGATALRRHLADKHGAYEGDSEGTEKAGELPVFFTDKEKAWVAESMAAAEDLVRRVAAEGDGAPVSREVVLRPQTSRSAREHVRECVGRRLPSVVVSFRRQPGSNALTTTTLTALTAAEAMRRAERDAQVRRREAVDVLGFRLVFEALVGSRKPCVGHNCFADLLFLMAALDEPLPETLRGWKTRVSALFPAVLDTKYLTASRADLFPAGRFPGTHLGGLFEQYGFASPRVRVSLPVGFEAYDPVALLASGSGKRKGGGGGSGGPAHEAAFDALMTGTVLLNVLAELGELRGADATVQGSVSAELVNKVALFRSLYAVDLCRLDGGDEYVPERLRAVVLDLSHDASVKTAQLESLLAQVVAASSPPLPALYSVDNASRTLAVLPGAGSGDGGGPPSALSVAEELALRFPTVVRGAVPYVPPHAQPHGRGGAAFPFPPRAVVERTLLRSAFPRKGG